MDEALFLTVATKLNNLTVSYSNGSLKHYQYVNEYDKVLESYNITKSMLLAEIEKRRKTNNI